MIISNCTREQIEDALKKANAKFNGNLAFKRFDSIGKRFNVTLRVNDSSGRGAKRGFTGRKTVNACWHGHGTFIDSLPKNAEILSRAAGQISHPGDQWHDWNIGSTMSPMYYSEACDC